MANGLQHPSACSHGASRSTLCPAFRGQWSGASVLSPIWVQARAEKKVSTFLENFLMGVVSAAVSKSAAALIERIKLLIQNRDEMLKFGSLSELYKGITDCFVRVIKDEGMLALWRGHTVNCARILPDQGWFLAICFSGSLVTSSPNQALNFAFRDHF
ncbi:hypothetical protein EUGRSUZ_B03361 [Eucalyptus grandis]|uniref:Uncharacterized protein n=2 Tax=Eucalyptus grandis TaxID=71139 RepID=A0ACC3LX70_EUCGR|nr:hypothetical protein EUGRSUZ_B03361 [Eucalyptus grandis]